MIEEGIELMLVGMGVVFAFLILLVGLMHLSGRFFTRFPDLFPEAKPVETASAENPTNSSERWAVALAAAYRARRGG